MIAMQMVIKKYDFKQSSLKNIPWFLSNKELLIIQILDLTKITEENLNNLSGFFKNIVLS